MAYSKVIPNSTRAENGFKGRQAELEALSKELADKELELATLENELAIFEERYARIIGVLFAELDELEKEIAEELLRLYPEEKYKNFQDAERRAKTSQDTAKEKLDQAEKKKFIPSEDLKNLYRKVAKTIHPDLSTNEDERAYRTILMAKANAAYKNGDQEALERILVEWEHRDGNSALKEAQPNESNQLKRKILQIKVHLTEIETKIAELKKSELYQLMLKVEQAEQQGRDLLGDMANNIQQKIQEAKARLDNLKRQREVRDAR